MSRGPIPPAAAAIRRCLLFQEMGPRWPEDRRGDADGWQPRLCHPGGALFVIPMDSSVVSRRTAKGILGNPFESTPPVPGDEAVIPEKVPCPTISRDLVNHMAIFLNAAFWGGGDR